MSALALASVLAALFGPVRTEAPPLEHAVWLAVPAIDAGRGAAIGYERWLPAHRLGASISGELRRSAAGDYDGVRAGAGAELRWYGRAHSRWSRQPRGSMVGWFAAARIDVGGDWLRDRVADRALGTTLVLGASVHVGYRLQPWRHLEITPSIGHAWRVEHDVSSRLPPWTRDGHTVGLTIGWMF